MTKSRLALVGVLSLLAAPAFVRGGGEPEHERPVVDPDNMEIPLSRVPSRVMAAARRAGPAARLLRVVRSLDEDDDTSYRFDAGLANRYYVITVRADGTVIEVGEEAERP